MSFIFTEDYIEVPNEYKFERIGQIVTIYKRSNDDYTLVLKNFDKMIVTEFKYKTGRYFYGISPYFAFEEKLQNKIINEVEDLRMNDIFIELQNLLFDIYNNNNPMNLIKSCRF